MSLRAYDELLLVVYLLLRTLFFRNTSGYQLTIFLVFYWLRILYNKETTNLFQTIIERLDGKVCNVKNPKVQHYWYKIKTFVNETTTRTRRLSLEKWCTERKTVYYCVVTGYIFTSLPFQYYCRF